MVRFALFAALVLLWGPGAWAADPKEAAPQNAQPQAGATESSEIPVKYAEPGMIEVPGGDFIRGRSYDWPDMRFKWYPNPAKDDTPIGPVVIPTFHMDEAEVTNGKYAEFVKLTGHRPPFHWIAGKFSEGEAEQPVANVSWDDAVAYCTWQGKRLPTEAEWEKACRGGLEQKKYPWGDGEPAEELAHYGKTEGPAAVCGKKRNGLGLCDMAGNVWEWVQDYYSTTYYADFTAPEDVENPRGPKEGLYRVLRGGGWYAGQSELFMTCSYRSWALPAERSPTMGFRCAKDAPGAKAAASK
jgi:formylglycine-generating enzyme